jgi:hypothetical protein
VGQDEAPKEKEHKQENETGEQGGEADPLQAGKAYGKKN